MKYQIQFLIIGIFFFLTSSIVSQTINVTAPGYYYWTSIDVAIEFKTVPPGGGNVTVNEFLSTPSPAPADGTVLSYYLEISTEMARNSFTAVVSVENAAPKGFSATALTQTPDSDNSDWLIIPSSYEAGVPDYYHFEVHHFSRFVFLQPNYSPKTLFLCRDNNNPLSSEVYLSDVAGTYGSGDWQHTADDQFFSLYITPENLSEFYGCDLELLWDENQIEYLSFTEGNIWALTNHNFFTYPASPVNNIKIQASAQNVPPQNLVAGSSSYIAKLDFKMLKPGFSIVELVRCVFRDTINNPVYFISGKAKIKYFLGDFTNGASPNSGDGEVDFEDLSDFSQVYFSQTTGWNGSNWEPTGTQYKRKFDIGPTENTNFIFDLPQPDNKIEFDDLSIFSFSYGYYNEQIYPEKNSLSPKQIPKLYFIPDSVSASVNDTFEIEVNIKDVIDLHAYSIMVGFPNQLVECISAIPGSFLGSTTFYYPLIKNDSGTVQFDHAILGNSAVSGSGDLFRMKFSALSNGNGQLLFDNYDLRDLQNDTISAQLDSGNIIVGLPVSINKPENEKIQVKALKSFPNPFNSTIRIEYEIAERQFVKLKIFDIRGALIASLFSNYQNAGKHYLLWDGTNDQGSSVASGIYLLQISGYNFDKTMKIYLLK